jgi:hypothetical protein
MNFGNTAPVNTTGTFQDGGGVTARTLRGAGVDQSAITDAIKAMKISVAVEDIRTADQSYTDVEAGADI